MFPPPTAFVRQKGKIYFAHSFISFLLMNLISNLSATEAANDFSRLENKLFPRSFCLDCFSFHRERGYSATPASFSYSEE